MAQATFSIRMDEKLKKQFDGLCAEFGMNATTAFNVFAKAVVRERRIPFEIQAGSDMAPKEINEEIHKAGQEDAFEERNTKNPFFS